MRGDQRNGVLVVKADITPFVATLAMMSIAGERPTLTARTPPYDTARYGAAVVAPPRSGWKLDAPVNSIRCDSLIAMRLRRKTTMTLGWTAQALRMGTKTHLSHLVHWQGKENKKNRHAS